MKQLCLRAAGFRLATPALVIVVLLSCTTRSGSAQIQATDKSERLKQIQSQGAYFTSDVWKTSYRDDLSDDEKIAGLSRLWSEVKYNFAYFERVPDLDWDKTYLEYLPRVRQTKSTLEYYRVLQEMCALLKDGHTSVSLPDELWRQMSARPPMRTEIIEGHCPARVGRACAPSATAIQTARNLLGSLYNLISWCTRPSPTFAPLAIPFCKRH